MEAKKKFVSQKTALEFVSMKNEMVKIQKIVITVIV